MKLQTAQFDRVFDIHHRADRFGIRTEFGFEAQGKKVYGVSVFGHHAIPVGQPLVVAMSQRAGWKAVYGWKNLSTGQLTVQPGRNNLVWFSIIGLAYVAFTTPLLIVSNASLTSAQQVVSGLVWLAGIGALSSMVRREWLQVKAQRVLAAARQAASQVSSAK